jgi:hypothetical protein
LFCWEIFLSSCMEGDGGGNGFRWCSLMTVALMLYYSREAVKTSNSSTICVHHVFIINSRSVLGSYNAYKSQSLKWIIIYLKEDII